MKTKYRYRLDYFLLIPAALWGTLACFSNYDSGFEYLYVVMTIGYLIFFCIDKKLLYLRIENNYIQVKHLFGTRIYFNDINSVEDSGQFLILKAKKNQIRN